VRGLQVAFGGSRVVGRGHLVLLFKEVGCGKQTGRRKDRKQKEPLT